MLAFLKRISHVFRRHIRQTGPARPSIEIQDRDKQHASYDNEHGRNASSPSMSISPLPLPELNDRGSSTAHIYADGDIFWNSILTEPENDGTSNHIVEMERGDDTSKEPYQRRSSDRELEDAESIHGSPTRKSIIFPNAPSSLKYIMPSIQECDSLVYNSWAEATCIKHQDSSNELNAYPVHTDVDKATAIQSESFNDSFNGDFRDSPILYSDSPIIPFPPFVDLSEHQVNGMKADPPTQCNSLTWDLALSQILDNEYIDPTTKQAIQERIQSKQFISGTENGKLASPLAVSAGLVPNFSYPIAGSAFINRSTAESCSLDTLANGIQNENYTDDTLTNGVTPNGYYAGSSSESSHDQQYRSNSTEQLPDRLLFLLTSELTRSELSLHNHMISNSSLPKHRKPFLQFTSTSETLPTIQSVEKLIQKLHNILHGLQDRINGLEDTLVPQLSTWLEQKTHQINKLNLEISNLREVVDFGNKTLAGCWTREAEFLHTLTESCTKKKKKHKARGGVFKQHKTREEEEMNNQQSACAFCSTPTPRVERKAPSKKDVHVLFNMATRNILILKRHVDQMITLVEECKIKTAPPAKDGQIVEGSWRDV